MKHYLADLDRRLNRIMGAVPLGEAGRKLRKRIAANRAHLFVFITNRDVPYTNNVSERHLRPSVIFRKVTNGFRCEWGAETYAASALSSAPQRPTALRCSMFCASCLPQTFPSTTANSEITHANMFMKALDAMGKLSDPMFGNVPPDDTVKLVFNLSQGDDIRGPWNEEPDFEYIEDPQPKGGMPPAPINPDDERSRKPKAQGKSRAARQR